ncbi:MAG TPA: SufD family Fe-S cluster assembly protein [Syntrophomonadaceae bacterium]|nr:SufD family Fe-S cluster assembly protein [Syntrophomonadaceae bacterium]
MKFNNIDWELLGEITELTEMPKGAINIRKDGQAIVRHSSPNITITSFTDKPGITVEIKAGTKDETVHVPVLLTSSGFQDKVYNTFIVGENADITIIAGCGIHNDSHADSAHDGIHEIIVKKGARMKYIERHYGQGAGQGKRVFNPTTVIRIEAEGVAELEMIQIEGVDDTIRPTTAYVGEKASLTILERLLTHGKQKAESDIKIYIEGKGGAAQILSRTIARDSSEQIFRAAMIGQTECLGHVECDSIIMGDAKVKAVPELVAESSEAVLTHEAAIGKIAGEQLVKLMSLGLTEPEAIDTILEGFLR